MASINTSGTQSNADPVDIQPTNDAADPLELLRPAERASYKTRHGTEGGQLHGCMQNTRVNIIADIERWAQEENAPKVFWLNGHLGTGKTSIAHTVCQRLDMQQLLGASFFCSRSGLRDATRIIPTIAAMLASSNPEIRTTICEVLTDDNTYVDFNSLIVNPIQRAIDRTYKMNKVIVIDALDECSSPWMVRTLLKTILNGIADIPLKFLFVSRSEDYIKNAFRHIARPSLVQEFTLHDVPRFDVQHDIQTYLRSALSEIANACGYSQHVSRWPPEEELMALLKQSDGRFIYAATAVRHIGAWGANFRWCLSDVVRSGGISMLQASPIDRLYLMILDQAFYRLEESKRILRRELLASVVLFETPLSVTGVASLLGMPTDQVEAGLSPFYSSVIHIPSGGPISIVHASFHRFILDSAHCGDGHHVALGKSHEMLTIKCLQLLNGSLRRNICNLPEDRVGELAHEIPDLSLISEALRYSCLHWASHLADGFSHGLADGSLVLENLQTFADEHLLHWFECLSVLGELETGLKSLGKANETLSRFANTHTEYHPIALLLKDGRRCLQLGFDAIEHHCLNTYHPVLMWLPKKSLMREKYRGSLGSVPRLLTGLEEYWGRTEQVMHHPKPVNSVAFSPDGTRVVSGSEDKIIRIWNAATGELEGVFEGHGHLVTCVAFSSDGARMVSGSVDQTVRVWNVAMGEIEHVLGGHSEPVLAIAFSPDGTHVVSGSVDMISCIWNVGTGQTEHLLKGHHDEVSSVAYSPDGTHVASGSSDNTVRLWIAATGDLEHVLEGGHSDEVWSVAYSHSGTRVVSASSQSVCVWNAVTGEIEHKIRGCVINVFCLAFSADVTRVVSASDNSVRIWNANTGEVERVLKGHLDDVNSVAFSPDGTHVISGAKDNSIRIWDATANGEIGHDGEMVHGLERHDSSWVVSVTVSRDRTGVVSGLHNLLVRRWNAATREMEVVEGHSDDVSCVAFSRDGRRVVSGSDDHSVVIWNAATGEMERILNGHSVVKSVAFSPDGTHVISGGRDNLIRMWNVFTSAEVCVLEGHSAYVSSVEFSRDGTRIVSGSADGSVRIWNAVIGEMEWEFRGVSPVNSVAFSDDGTCIIAGSGDRSLRIWNTATGDLQCLLQDLLDAVAFAAFSPDGTHIVAGLDDGSIWIWDSTFPLSFSLPCHFSFHFPDGSRVTHIFPGKFQFFTPNQPGVVLSLDSEWILSDWPRGDCWIPQCDNGPLAISGSKVCLGTGSGRVIILDLASLHSHL